MDEQEHSCGVEEAAKSGVLTFREGPFKAKTCFVEKYDRIRMKVELPFKVSIVVDVKLKNFERQELSIQFADIKSSIILLIGGRNVILDEVGEAWNGVHPARMFISCRKPPENVAVIEDGNKLWMDLGDYLMNFGHKVKFDQNEVKADYGIRR